jgi:hypothetical protein
MPNIVPEPPKRGDGLLALFAATLAALAGAAVYFEMAGDTPLHTRMTTEPNGPVLEGAAAGGGVLTDVSSQP